MSHHDYHELVNMGRKAGLNTRELYRALTTCPADRQAAGTGQTDCNGFTSDVSPEGRVAYHPVNKRS